MAGLFDALVGASGARRGASGQARGASLFDALLAAASVDPRPQSGRAPLRIVLHPELEAELDSIHLHRCVLAVVKSGPQGYDADQQLSRAFGICVSALQDNGSLYRGSRKATAKGRAAGYKKAQEVDALEKERAYQRLKASAKAARASRRAQGGSPQPSGLEVGLQRPRGGRGAANVAAGSSWSQVKILKELKKLREAMEPVFSCSTVFGDCTDVPSAGHCFMAALAVQDVIGGEIMQGRVKATPHYWNRVGGWDVDITGDQFGEAAVQVKWGALRPNGSFVFPRKRYEPLLEVNKKPGAIYKRFRKKLVNELTERGLCDYVDHLERMK